MLRPCSISLWLGAMRVEGAHLQKKVSTTVLVAFNSKAKAPLYEKVILVSELAVDVDISPGLCDGSGTGVSPNALRKGILTKQCDEC